MLAVCVFKEAHAHSIVDGVALLFINQEILKLPSLWFENSSTRTYELASQFSKLPFSTLAWIFELPSCNQNRMLASVLPKTMQYGNREIKRFNNYVENALLKQMQGNSTRTLELKRDSSPLYGSLFRVCTHQCEFRVVYCLYVRPTRSHPALQYDVY